METKNRLTYLLDKLKEIKSNIAYYDKFYADIIILSDDQKKIADINNYYDNEQRFVDISEAKFDELSIMSSFIDSINDITAKQSLKKVMNKKNNLRKFIERVSKYKLEKTFNAFFAKKEIEQARKILDSYKISYIDDTCDCCSTLVGDIIVEEKKYCFDCFCRHINSIISYDNTLLLPEVLKFYVDDIEFKFCITYSLVVNEYIWHIECLNNGFTNDYRFDSSMELIHQFQILASILIDYFKSLQKVGKVPEKGNILINNDGFIINGKLYTPNEFHDICLKNQKLLEYQFVDNSTQTLKKNDYLITYSMDGFSIVKELNTILNDNSYYYDYSGFKFRLDSYLKKLKTIKKVNNNLFVKMVNDLLECLNEDDAIQSLIINELDNLLN